MPATGLPGTIGNLVRRRELLFGEAMFPLEKSQGVQFPEIAANIQSMTEPNEQIAEGSTKVPAMTTIRKPDPPEQETKHEVEAKPPIPNTEILWRYVPLETLFCYLSESIFIPSLQMLHKGDPFEAECLFDPMRFSHAMREQYGKEHESEIFSFLDGRKRPPAKERHEAYFDFLRKTRYAWCWFCRTGESALMWKTYGRRGAAIRTTVGKLRSLLESCGRHFVYGPILYVTVHHGQVRCPHLYPDRPEAQPFLLEPCFLKRSEYKDEDEVRFVATTAELDDGFFLRPKEVGVPIKADWIEHIWLSPDLRSSEARALTEAIKQLHPAIPCRRSELLSSQEQQFTDSMRGASDEIDALAESGWRDGSDGVPEALKKLLVGANRTAGQNGNTKKPKP